MNRFTLQVGPDGALMQQDANGEYVRAIDAQVLDDALFQVIEMLQKGQTLNALVCAQTAIQGPTESNHFLAADIEQNRMRTGFPAIPQFSLLNIEKFNWEQRQQTRRQFSDEINRAYAAGEKEACFTSMRQALSMMLSGDL